MVTNRMTLRYSALVIGLIMEECGRKVGLAVRLVRSDLDRMSLECQWEEVQSEVPYPCLKSRKEIWAGVIKLEVISRDTVTVAWQTATFNWWVEEHNPVLFVYLFIHLIIHSTNQF